MAKTYWEKLKDPRWQRKRLEILEREDFTCQACGDKSSTLNVHHGYYEKGLDPWEYDPETLWCLCEGCHEEAQCHMRDLQFELAKVHPSRHQKAMLAILSVNDESDADPLSHEMEIDTIAAIIAFPERSEEIVASIEDEDASPECAELIARSREVISNGERVTTENLIQRVVGWLTHAPGSALFCSEILEIIHKADRKARLKSEDISIDAIKLHFFGCAVSREFDEGQAVNS